MKKNILTATILTIAACFMALTGCTGIQHKPDNNYQLLAQGQQQMAEAINSQTAAIQTLAGAVAKPSAPAPAAADDEGMVPMEEITGPTTVTEETIAPAPAPAAPARNVSSVSDSDLANKVAKLEKKVANHEGRLNSLEYFQARIDLEVTRLGAKSPAQLDGWEFGYYAYGSSQVHQRMLEAMDAVAKQLKTELDEAAKAGEALTLTFTFTSYTDEKGTPEGNKKTGFARSVNCRTAFLAALNKAGVTSVKTEIKDGSIETRGVTSAIKRYTRVEKKVEKSPLPKPATPAPAAANPPAAKQ